MSSFQTWHNYLDSYTVGSQIIHRFYTAGFILIQNAYLLIWLGILVWSFWDQCCCTVNLPFYLFFFCPRWLYMASQLEPWCGGVFCFVFWYCSYLWWSLHPTCFFFFFYIMFRQCTCIRKINAVYFSQYLSYSYMINSY